MSGSGFGLCPAGNYFPLTGQTPGHRQPPPLRIQASVDDPGSLTCSRCCLLVGTGMERRSLFVVGCPTIWEADGVRYVAVNSGWGGAESIMGRRGDQDCEVPESGWQLLGVQTAPVVGSQLAGICLGKSGCPYGVFFSFFG